jgi:multidrug resistance efflux pump
MEKIIFLVLAIPILAFVLYLGGSAIMKGFNAKAANRSAKEEESEKNNFVDNKENLSDELNRLNDLLKNGVLTQEEFEKAKKKILDN